MLLPDINVWIALAFDSHLHHAAALKWFQTSNDLPLYFCRLTQQGFLRIATNPKAVGADAVTLNNAWSLYDQMLGDDRIVYKDEPKGIEPVWRRLTVDYKFSNKVWSDAYLAAFAIQGSLRLVSFDKGFAKFPDLQSQILS
ncbi:TA system VapC family ribonuclease toxin [Aeoliella mucimassa]|uniref:Ribonuclease VapC n=1 Tax=Aeoliella mucimassa TaxID=2527972 RepID=A0A518AHU7_9BACT|nr:TA system VapC family ribonuclease toxin [Aeoliella mucimassa]QDU54299.1 Ribonuclease VapC41 [Aeoliella mucimassa]